MTCTWDVDSFLWIRIVLAKSKNILGSAIKGFDHFLNLSSFEKLTISMSVWVAFVWISGPHCISGEDAQLAECLPFSSTCFLHGSMEQRFIWQVLCVWSVIDPDDSLHFLEFGMLQFIKFMYLRKIWLQCFLNFLNNSNPSWHQEAYFLCSTHPEHLICTFLISLML